MAIINYLVEGETDEAVALKIISGVGHEIGAGFCKKGSSYIKQKIAKFSLSARNNYYLALVDFMDTVNECDCPPEVVTKWLPHKNKLMIFRVVVREIESWILADRRNIANFFQCQYRKNPSKSRRRG